MILTAVILAVWFWSTFCIYKLEKGKGLRDILICSMWFITIPLFLIVWSNDAKVNSKQWSRRKAKPSDV